MHKLKNIYCDESLLGCCHKRKPVSIFVSSPSFKIWFFNWVKQAVHDKEQSRLGHFIWPKAKIFQMKKYHVLWQKNQCPTFNQVCVPRSRRKKAVLADGKQGVALCRILDVRTKTLKKLVAVEETESPFCCRFFSTTRAMHCTGQAVRHCYYYRVVQRTTFSKCKC